MRYVTPAMMIITSLDARGGRSIWFSTHWMHQRRRWWLSHTQHMSFHIRHWQFQLWHSNGCTLGKKLSDLLRDDLSKMRMYGGFWIKHLLFWRMQVIRLCADMFLFTWGYTIYGNEKEDTMTDWLNRQWRASTELCLVQLRKLRIGS